MPIGHVSLPTGSHFKEMRTFYLSILQPLGYTIYKESIPEEWCGFGKPTCGPDFWLHGGGQDVVPFDGNLEKRAGKAHVALSVSSPKEVEKWYSHAVTKVKAISNGKPGERVYIKGYYAAYIIDPVGNNIEVVCFNPLWMKMLNAAPYVLSVALGAGLTLGYQAYFG